MLTPETPGTETPRKSSWQVAVGDQRPITRQANLTAVGVPGKNHRGVCFGEKLKDAQVWSVGHCDTKIY